MRFDTIRLFHIHKPFFFSFSFFAGFKHFLAPNTLRKVVSHYFFKQIYTKKKVDNSDIWLNNIN